MDRYETQVEIDQPPSVVFDFLVDEENMPLWLTNFIRLERIKGEQGEVGAIARHIYSENGKKITLLEEITAAQKGRLLESVLHHKLADMKIRNEIEPKNGSKTTLRVILENRPKHFFANIIYWLTKKRILRRHKQNIESLKTAIETLTE